MLHTHLTREIYFHLKNFYRSRLTGVAAGYVFMFIGMVIGGLLLLGRAQEQLQKLPQIIAVQPAEEKEKKSESDEADNQADNRSKISTIS